MNIGKLMKQAQEMQAKMQEMQNNLGDLEVQGTSGGGMVTVTLSGKAEMKSIKLDKEAVDPTDIEMLEDLIVAACNDAKNKVESAVAEKMAEATAGMNIPPGMIPGM